MGINPLFGMIRQLRAGAVGEKAVLLYSAAEEPELVFRPELDAMAMSPESGLRVGSQAICLLAIDGYLLRDRL